MLILGSVWESPEQGLDIFMATSDGCVLLHVMVESKLASRCMQRRANRAAFLLQLTQPCSKFHSPNYRLIIQTPPSQRHLPTLLHEE